MLMFTIAKGKEQARMRETIRSSPWVYWMKLFIEEFCSVFNYFTSLPG